jgi:ubiquinone/menaquinone biosynthesis C-methylase UbiE
MKLDHWETYYRGGAIVSCPTGAEANYSLEVRDAWVRFFGALPDGARILDIGCGNGPLVLIAKETAAEMSRIFEIDAVDLADIDPLADVAGGRKLFDGVRFHARVSTEDLPFEASTFDAVCGQYIIEYTNVSKTLGEAARVLRPGGPCQLVVHHKDSIVVRNARESLRQADMALNELKVLRRFRRYCELLEQSPETAGPAEKSFFDAGARMGEAAKGSSNPLFLEFVINAIKSLLKNRSRIGPAELLRQTKRLEDELTNWVRRLDDLASGARTACDMQEMVSQASDAGFESIELAEQMQDVDTLVGWRLSMHRAT